MPSAPSSVVQIVNPPLEEVGHPPLRLMPSAPSSVVQIVNLPLEEVGHPRLAITRLENQTSQEVDHLPRLEARSMTVYSCLGRGLLERSYIPAHRHLLEGSIFNSPLYFAFGRLSIV